MQKTARLAALLWVALPLIAALNDAHSERLNFLSTQLRPLEEAQKMRTVILKNFPQEVDYTTEEPQQFSLRVKEEQEGGTRSIDLVGALHGELQPLAQLDALAPLDDLALKVMTR